MRASSAAFTISTVDKSVNETMITIYHNPRCSKSREALALVEQFATAKSLKLQLVDYLKTPPALSELIALQRQLGTSVDEMVRANEEEFASLNLGQADDMAVLQAIAAHPKLLQRPIVVYRNKAMVGRPPERLHAFLQTD